MEQIVAVPQILEHSVEVIQHIGQEQGSERIDEQIFAPQTLAQTVDVMKETWQERVSERAVVTLTQCV